MKFYINRIKILNNVRDNDDDEWLDKLRLFIDAGFFTIISDENPFSVSHLRGLRIINLLFKNSLNDTHIFLFSFINSIIPICPNIWYLYLVENI